MSGNKLSVFVALLAGLLPGTSFADTLGSDFSSGFQPWVPLFSGEWIIEVDGANSSAVLDVPGIDRPPVRRPRSYLFLEGHTWQDYVITLVGKTLAPAETTRRDICILFGYADDTHYYYAHISSQADAVHNVIMRVDGDQRQTIHLEASPLPLLDGSLQTFRVEHDANGAIRVYVDDLTTPMMTANDTRYPRGAVAFGSFDDRALFDSVSVTGTLVAPAKTRAALEANAVGELLLRFPTQMGFSYLAHSGATLPPDELGLEVVVGSGSEVSVPIDGSLFEKRYFQVTTVHPLLATP